jgi:hypothetical protein
MSAATSSQVRGMLLAPWQWRRNDGGPWALRLYGALAVLLLAAPALAALVWMEREEAWRIAWACACLGLTVLWCEQFNGLLRLDHPRAVHAVPGHRNAVRAAATGLWLAIVVLCGVLSGVAAEWLAGNGLRVGLAVALGMGTLLLLLALAFHSWWVWIPLCVAPSFLGVSVWRKFVFGTGVWLQQLWLAQPLGMSLVVLALQGLLLQGLFGSGDERHARVYASRERLRKISVANSAGEQSALAAYGRWGEWLGMPTQRLADAWLARVCHQAQVGPHSAMTRAEVVLHGTQHWVRHLSTVLLVQVVVAVCLLLVAGLTPVSLKQLLEGGRVGLVVGLTSMALGAVLSLPGALWQSRREQALLMLLPGMPQGAALNRAVAWRQMRQCLWLWGATLPAMAVMAWAGHGLHALAFVATALPMSAWLWRDLSRLRARSGASTFVPIALCLLAGGASVFLLTRRPDMLWPWAAAVLLVSAILLAWRWRGLQRWPQALPVGRLA